MGLISLTSDFGIRDGNLARIKAKLLQKNSELSIIDVSHSINPFDVFETAYVLNDCWKYFPENSIHLIWVGALEHPTEQALCGKINNQYFICNNNGLLSILAQNEKSEVRNINSNSSSRENDFIQCALSLSENFSYFNTLTLSTNEKIVSTLQPNVNENSITGAIIYIDNYGNAVSNITKRLFTQMQNDRSFSIFANHHRFSKIQTHYSDVVKDFENENQYSGRSMVLFNSQNLLEFALYKSNHNSVGGASQLLGLDKGQKIIINFE